MSVHGFKNVHCPSYREYSYSKMIEKRQGPTPGFRLREKLFERELTDSTFFCKLPLKKFYLIYPRGFAGFLTWPFGMVPFYSKRGGTAANNDPDLSQIQNIRV